MEFLTGFSAKNFNCRDERNFVKSYSGGERTRGEGKKHSIANMKLNSVRAKSASDNLEWRAAAPI
jgi:hypothetical protein